MATSTRARKARPHQRYFARDGTLLPGVTAILAVISKPALYRWNNQMGLKGVDTTQHVGDLAAAGTCAHHLIECMLTGAEQDISAFTPDQVRLAENSLACFRTWARDKVLETRQMELALVSTAHCFGGTCDWYGLVDGVQTVIDFKTSQAVWDDHCYQIAAYHGLLVEAGYEVDEARVLALGRDAGEGFSERVLPGPAIESYWRVFLAALSLKGAIDATKKRRSRRW